MIHKQETHKLLTELWNLNQQLTLLSQHKYVKKALAVQDRAAQIERTLMERGFVIDGRDIYPNDL